MLSSPESSLEAASSPLGIHFLAKLVSTVEALRIFLSLSMGLRVDG